MKNTTTSGRIMPAGVTFRQIIAAQTGAILLFCFFYILAISPQSGQTGNGLYNDPSDLALTHELLDGKDMSLLEAYAFVPMLAMDKYWQNGPQSLRWVQWTGMVAIIGWLLLLSWFFVGWSKRQRWSHPLHLLLFAAQTLVIIGWLLHTKGLAIVHNAMHW